MHEALRRREQEGSAPAFTHEQPMTVQVGGQRVGAEEQGQGVIPIEDARPDGAGLQHPQGQPIKKGRRQRQEKEQIFYDKQHALIR